MQFVNPWGLLAFLSVPAVLFLHLFRRKFQEKRVSALFLFVPEAIYASAGRTRTKLVQSVSLWLELLAAFFLSLWLSGISFGFQAPQKHWVLVLDDSASMRAQQGPSRSFERARERILDLLESASAEDTITVLLTGDRPEMLAGPRSPLAGLPEALQRWDPKKTGHELGAALNLGLEIAEPGDELFFVSDHRYASLPRRYQALRFGKALPNLGIVSAQRSADGNGEKVWIELQSWADSTQETELIVRLVNSDLQETQELYREKKTLASQSRTRVSLSLSSSDLPLSISLSPDVFDLDQTWLLLPEPKKIVRVCSLLPADVQKSIHLEKLWASLPQIAVESSPELAQLVLSAAPGQLKSWSAELVFPPVGEDRESWLGPFLWERNNPLFQGITLEGVVWTTGKADLPGFASLFAGEQALISEEETQEGLRVSLNLDPQRSNFFESPDWPILFANLVEQTRAHVPGPDRLNVLVGRELLFRKFGNELAEQNPFELEDPQGVRRLGGGSANLLSWKANSTGLHRLYQGSRQRAVYSVHFLDASESDLRDCSSGEDAAIVSVTAMQAGAASRSGDWEKKWFGILLVLLVCADWFVLSRWAWKRNLPS